MSEAPRGWQVFAKSGVPRGKLGVMPEAVDTAFFDPALAAGERRQVPSQQVERQQVTI